MTHPSGPSCNFPPDRNTAFCRCNSKSRLPCDSSERMAARLLGALHVQEREKRMSEDGAGEEAREEQFEFEDVSVVLSPSSPMGYQLQRGRRRPPKFLGDEVKLVSWLRVSFSCEAATAAALRVGKWRHVLPVVQRGVLLRCRRCLQHQHDVSVSSSPAYVGRVASVV
jgi:hypothetical protein